jgi:hypothetical protein
VTTPVSITSALNGTKIVPPSASVDGKTGAARTSHQQPRKRLETIDFVHVDPAPPLSNGLETAKKPTPQVTWSDLKALKNYWNHGSNRDIVKALAWKYGPGLLVSAALVLPLGWIIAVVGAIPAWLAGRRGEKMVSELLTSGKLDMTHGPLAKITKISALWEESDNGQTVGKNVPVQIMHEFNKLLNDIFPGERGSDASRLRAGLKLTTSSRWFNLLNHAFNARQYYTSTLVGSTCRAIRQGGSQVPIVPFQVLCRIPELLTLPIISLFHMEEIRRMARV